MRFIGATLAVLLMFGLGCKPPEDTSVAQQDPDAPVETELVKAEAGVGKQGQVIGNKDGFLRTPAKAFFKAKQQLEFLKVQHALNLYDAEHGFKPKTEEESWRRSLNSTTSYCRNFPKVRFMSGMAKQES